MTATIENPTREDVFMRFVIAFIILSVLCAVAMMCAGCTNNPFSTSAGRLEVTWVAYNSTLEAIQILIDNGEISEEDAQVISVVIRSTKRRLNVWHAKVLADVDTRDAERAAKAEMANLKEKTR